MRPWASDFVDVLINRWRHHPELVWQTVGAIVEARPNLINRDQLIQIHGWSTVDPAANKALRRIESSHPDIFLVGP